MDAARGSVVENIPTVGVLHKLLKKIFEGCVNTILRWTRLVVFLRLERASALAQLCDVTLPCLFLPATFVCSTVASLCAFISHTVSICEGCALRHGIFH